MHTFETMSGINVFAAALYNRFFFLNIYPFTDMPAVFM